MSELAVRLRIRDLRRSWRSWVAPVAGLSSCMICVIGVVWTVGLAGSPLGLDDRRAGEVGSLLEGLESQQVGWTAIIVGLAGMITALAAWRMPARRWPAIPGLCLCLVLLLLIPDVRVIQNFLYLFFGYVGLWDTGLAAMSVSIICGLLWLLVALAQLTRASSLGIMLRKPRWSVAITYTAAALALPYPIVRIAWGLGVPLGVPDGYLGDFVWWQRLGLVIFFGGIPVAGAILTIGLVRPWGVVFPRWVPWLRRRLVPVWAAVVPGTVAAVLICQMGLRVTPSVVGHLDEMSWNSWGEELPGLFILPWGVALAAAVYAYAAGRLGPSPDDRPAAARISTEAEHSPR